MRISKANLTAHVCADPKTDFRPVLHGVLFDPAGTTSSDGFRLLHVPYPDGTVPTDLPAPTIVPATLCEQAGKAAKPAKQEPYGDCAAVYVDGLSIRLTADNGARESVSFTGTTIAGTYPNYVTIRPTATPISTIRMNTSLLSDLLTQMTKAGASIIELSIFAADGPILLRQSNADVPEHRRAWALQMPIAPAKNTQEK